MCIIFNSYAMATRYLPDIYAQARGPEARGAARGCGYIYLIKNSQAVKKGAAPKKAMVKKDVKSKVAAKKWL